jgi:apolipoprotein N-acyltransferase
MEQPTTDVVTVVVPSYALGGFVSPYMRAGNWFAWLCLAAMAGTALWLAGTRLRRGGTTAETEDAPAAQAGTKP